MPYIRYRTIMYEIVDSKYLRKNIIIIIIIIIIIYHQAINYKSRI